jgi:hypothetical protein
MVDVKPSQEKHRKYIEFYKDLNAAKEADTEYWGLGIENESYLMLSELESTPKVFLQKNHIRERYSVDYWINYRTIPLEYTFALLPPDVVLPTYINSYQFRKCDLLGEHRTLQNKNYSANPLYSDESIDQYLKRVSPVFNHLFDKQMIYDGDTFEFTTFNFYKANVLSVIKELREIKALFLKEMNMRLVSKFTCFKYPIVYPQFNYGFAKFMSNRNNLAICNNGTYHINITLPTKLDSSGNIANPDEFRSVHANAIRAIQWIEPLLVALYGSPDILHLLNPIYAGGSQRLAISRYIGLGTYDTNTMEKGKLLDTFDYKRDAKYFRDLHLDSPYVPPETSGYDFNYNKFKKHGIEFRIFDYFPDEYLESVMNLLVLVCAYSTTAPIPNPRDCPIWEKLCVDAIKKGSAGHLRSDAYLLLYGIFGVKSWYRCCFHGLDSPLRVLGRIGTSLYKRYSRSEICKKMSPSMARIKLVDYNALIKAEFKKVLFKIK